MQVDVKINNAHAVRLQEYKDFLQNEVNSAKQRHTFMMKGTEHIGGMMSFFKVGKDDEKNAEEIATAELVDELYRDKNVLAFYIDQEDDDFEYAVLSAEGDIRNIKNILLGLKWCVSDTLSLEEYEIQTLQRAKDCIEKYFKPKA